MPVIVENQNTVKTDQKESAFCYHCGHENKDRNIFIGDQYFCCQGCKTVFQILSENNLCRYYDIENHPGLPLKNVEQPVFDYLDNEEIKNQIIHYQDDKITKIIFYIPGIHCSSCIWILENFYRIDPAVTESRVDFLKKQLFISYNTSETSLRKIAETLASIGYEPLINLQNENEDKTRQTNRDLISKIAVAGFCTGNIMMFSFPEYFGLDTFSQNFGYLFKYLNVIFSLPVLFYSGSVYFQSVIQSLKKGILNIDTPILAGILATFTRSIIEVATQTGAGYFDSMSGLILLLLIGKWFTSSTFSFLSFERDYKSYFPLSVYKLEHDTERAVSVNSLKKGDKIRIKNNQIVPADSILYSGKAHIDFSFVTGESALITKNPGDLIYAGGRQKGGVIDVEIVKKVSQSYLTQLWNNEAFSKKHAGNDNHQAFSNTVAKYFTICILTIATGTALYWAIYSPSKAWNAFTAVLIIACPCTLALSYPMTLGNTLRQLGKAKCFLKNIETIEILAQTDVIVFDKTGTITENESFDLEWYGAPFTYEQKKAVASLAHTSNHPLSRLIYTHLKPDELYHVKKCMEFVGKGVDGEVKQMRIRMGKYGFVMNENDIPESKTKVHIVINEAYSGYFVFKNKYKNFMPSLIKELYPTHQLFVLSGDGDGEREKLHALFGNKALVYFNQSPQQKLNFIKKLQVTGHKVIMCGDGLNDSGALKQADTGIAITQDSSHFTPSSDVILEGNALEYLPSFIRQAKQSMLAVKISFAVSLVYNCIGLSFAIRGDLQPIIAAIIMPVSSISVVLTAMLASGTMNGRTTLYR